MLFPAHLLLGLLILRIAIEINPDDYSKSMFFVIFSLVAAVLPDLDVFRKSKFKDHHKSLFHAPLFWGIVFIIFFGFNKPLALLFGTLIFTHLFFDYITARTAGVALFYPYSSREHSLFKIKPTKGDFYLFELKKLGKYLQFYVKNRLLTSIEVAICILGIAAIIF
jgi:hypothetical protein